jgi:hypothetical protein
MEDFVISFTPTLQYFKNEIYPALLLLYKDFRKINMVAYSRLKIRPMGFGCLELIEILPLWQLLLPSIGQKYLFLAVFGADHGGTGRPAAEAGRVGPGSPEDVIVIVWRHTVQRLLDGETVVVVVDERPGPHLVVQQAWPSCNNHHNP